MGSAGSNTFDFIVVGAGPAGALVATRLAKSKKAPSVLLIEAGGRNDNKAVRVDAERWLHRMTPGMNWSYKTVPIKGFDGRVIEFDRGKGLGGSSAINFSVWTIGPKDEFDEIARIVGDDEWQWENVQQRFKRIESFNVADGDMPADLEPYHHVDPAHHGRDGPIKVGFPKKMEPSNKEMMDIWTKHGFEPNPDHNSGNPIGMSLNYSSAHHGVRSTAADALINHPTNLHIIVDAEVTHLVLSDTRVTGITTVDGRTFHARNEVILSCGTLDTPRVLMHSGIGSPTELQKFNIPIVHANENVGKNLMDHHHLIIHPIRGDPTSKRLAYYQDPDQQTAARAQWEKDGSGPLSEFACIMGIGFQKLPELYNTPEFKDLPQQQQEFLRKPTVPHYEVCVNGPFLPHFMDPANAATGTSIFIFNLNLRSRGTVSLQSSDPTKPLLYDPNYFSHPYDKRSAILTLRDTMRILYSEDFQKGTTSIDIPPRNASDEDLLKHWVKNTTSTWHMMGTASMGKSEQEGAVVDKDFRVFGVEGLRVADMSVIPVVCK
jgi:choline dehydrogenase-like flavoprotein